MSYRRCNECSKNNSDSCGADDLGRGPADPGHLADVSDGQEMSGSLRSQESLPLRVFAH